MYNPPPTGHNLLRHLRNLFKILNCLGLTGIAFNHTQQMFVHPNWRQKVTRCIYDCTLFLSAIIIIKGVMESLLIYTASKTHEGQQSVNAQEETIAVFSSYIHTTSALVYSLNYVRNKRKILEYFNEALDIFRRLQVHTGSELFLSSNMVKVIYAKVVIVVASLRLMLFLCLVMFWMFLMKQDYTFFPILSALMVLSYIYVQLILVCFYEKMNGYLETLGLSLKRRRLAKCLRQFMTISGRIHVFRRNLNSFANAVFTSTYFGLFHDIKYIYFLFKNVFYSKYFSNEDTLRVRVFSFFPTCISFSFDMFIIALLSDKLEKANKRFQNLVVALSGRLASMQREVDVMLMEEHISGLGFEAFGQIKVDQQFVFGFMINTVLVFVITFLQFFASEQVYTENFHRLNFSYIYLLDT